MSQTYIAIVISLLGTFLPKLGVTIGSDALTTTVSTLITIGTAMWILIRRYKAGGISKLGMRKV